jgi:hypothetical protein
VYLGVLPECPLISMFTWVMGTLVGFKGSNQEKCPSMIPIAGSIFTGIGAVPLTSKMLVGDFGSCVKVCVGAGVAGAAQETKKGTTSRNSFMFFILVSS